MHRGLPRPIDLPQVVDLIGNPQGPDDPARDVGRAGGWFLTDGLPDDGHRPESLRTGLRERAGPGP